MTHVINRLDHRGHGPIAKWSPEHKGEIKTAEKVFKAQQLKGVKLYDISDPQKQPHPEMKVFDPSATEILAVPYLKIVGG